MQELPPVTVPTPSDAAVVTTTVRRSIWERVFDISAVVGTFVFALLQSLGDIDWASLGFTPKQAAWAGLFLFILRFYLGWKSVRLVGTTVQPSPPTGNKAP
ncbi:hypothetical protein [Methylorubrum extorquens]|uniref:Uncharacterized protein n=2 Tax=Methylorubrum extorquens TaxID=408 RepID=C5B187_METEA|nr:hypothetical protein [Methylorubrum extorquens]ACS41688.1 Hypothetical protein MexAM1_META1p4014 [Methylorubrum extorquens AM1]EHP94857.1 hypothetical protein MetexDRAFT_0202 [Methylorubrum extorquens DSM 13060]MCP1545295.1 hypothetical protein [Methylorubrum extorquens]MCP1587358.1 hypothetical protein [Methylorubrum extorquens]